jgi:hypothetical protein
MKHNLWRFSLLAVLVAVFALSPVVPALAQPGDDPGCHGLNPADCELVEAAEKKMDGVTVFAVPSWSYDLELTVDGETMQVQASGSAAFDLDEDDPVIQLVLESMTVESPDGDEALSAEILIADKMLYVNWEGEWYGGPLARIGGGEFFGEGFEPEGLPGLFGGEMFSGDMGEMFEEDMLDLSAAVVSARGEDAELDGQPMAVITTEADLAKLLAALLTSPVSGFMGEILGESDFEMGEFDAEDMQFLSLVLAPMFEGTSIQVSEMIGLEDGYIHQFALDIVLDLNLTLLAPEVGEIAGTMTSEINIGDFDVPVEVTAPEDYRPLRELDMENSPLAV